MYNIRKISMKIVFLKAPIPLTKTYIKLKDGSIETHPYPNAYEVTSIEESCTDMKAFEQLVRKHAALGHTLLKGQISRPLISESRKGTTDSNGVTDWIVFDLDGIPSCSTVDQFLIALGFGDVSHVVQYSASYGIKNKDLRAHVFMQLAKPMSAPLLKQWLIEINHRVDMLRNAMTLTRTGNSLSWPLDITACQNDKLIYIASPVLKGGIKDPLSAKSRISYVPRKLATLTLPATISSTEINKDKTIKRINELRESTGLPARKWVFKTVGATQVLTKPDSSTISEMKTDRGYVYFNLNGGDSWGYYHPENNPDFIYNFKGEPAYLTKELLPEYWEQITQQAVKVSSGGIMFLTFLDKKTSTYYRGTYDAANDMLDIYAAKNADQIRSFAKQHGVPLGDFIPEWDLIFDPKSRMRVDQNTKVINSYEPTVYGKQKPRKVTAVPPTIAKIIHHALGSDDEVYEHFLNWLACIFQYKTRTMTAWVLHGTEGTGKGVLMNRIIRPLLGTKQTASRHMEELNEPYNHWMANCFVAFIDEIQTKALKNEKGVAAKMRNWITEPKITVREMFVGGYEAENHCNWILASNMPDPVVITSTDRRHNIAIYQPDRLFLTEKELARIDGELQNFHDYMMSRVADKKVAGELIDTVDRRTLISISETSVDIAATRLIEGNLEFFVDQLPSDDSYKRDALRNNKVEDYKKVLVTLIDRADVSTGACHVSRDELHTLFDYTVGNVPDTPNKFTSMLKHHRIHMSKVWISSRAVQGIKTTWCSPELLSKLREIVEPPVAVPPKLKSVGGKK